jgi:pimeloyl-ACP methyl ester carboxylesterase
LIAADDRTIEPQLQRRFAERLPGVRCVEVEGGHNCMITRPRQVATALASFRS